MSAICKPLVLLIIFQLLNIYVSYPAPGRMSFEVTYRRPDMSIGKDNLKELNVKFVPRSFDLETYDQSTHTIELSPARLGITPWKY